MRLIGKSSVVGKSVLRVYLMLLLIAVSFFAIAGEGMWIPLLLEKYSIEDMQDQGFRLSAEDIYNVNASSLKDAVVIFGGGCTGAVVSEKGLVFTNHHCGYRYIQSHSSVENDYLTHGFWAMHADEELPNPSLTVSFLDRIEDVSSRVLRGTEKALTESSRQAIIQDNITAIKEELKEEKHQRIVIKPFYYGNEYYMFVYTIFPDVRLVGSPPGSIGNFGKDSDNWMWPRHTGDFSVFRIYADKNNKPADYSSGNVPYQPKKVIPISPDGPKEGDFTMVMGYPGSTDSYILSDAVDLMLHVSLPKKIALRDARLSIMDRYMRQDEKTRIQYASKYRSVSNAYKKWKGIIMGLEKTGALAEKKEKEKRFSEWVSADTERMDKYGEVLPGLKKLYGEIADYSLVYEYSSEAFLSVEIMELILDLNSFLSENSTLSDSLKHASKERFLEHMDSFYKDYNKNIDEEIYAAMLQAFHDDIQTDFHPGLLNTIQQKYKGDFSRFARKQFKASILTSKKELSRLLEFYPAKERVIRKKMRKDPLVQDFLDFTAVYGEDVWGSYDFPGKEIERLYRLYMEGLREMESPGYLYPDANFTMRVAYGKVEGFSPMDAVSYDYHTTLSGVMEKSATGIYDYSITSKLQELYTKKDYGVYADSTGSMNTCFIASNHTSGGNSGSPVMNSYGELLGLNFDRNWEGTMSDIHYDESLCRNIIVDIRYILFVIDKYAGAGYLIDELEFADRESE